MMALRRRQVPSTATLSRWQSCVTHDRNTSGGRSSNVAAMLPEAGRSVLQCYKQACSKGRVHSHVSTAKQLGSMALQHTRSCSQRLVVAGGCMVPQALHARPVGTSCLQPSTSDSLKEALISLLSHLQASTCHSAIFLSTLAPATDTPAGLRAHVICGVLRQRAAYRRQCARQALLRELMGLLRGRPKPLAAGVLCGAAATVLGCPCPRLPSREAGPVLLLTGCAGTPAASVARWASGAGLAGALAFWLSQSQKWRSMPRRSTACLPYRLHSCWCT